MNTALQILIYRLGLTECNDALLSFCKESNRIEGEKRARQNDMDALSEILTAHTVGYQTLAKAHELYSKHSKLLPEERGEWRKCNVRVGSYIAPDHEQVPALMQEFIEVYNHDRFLSSFTLHCMFEKIHPFVDFNGRMGRALWLRRAVLDEGYDCSLGFLHKFYYQSLSAFE